MSIGHEDSPFCNLGITLEYQEQPEDGGKEKYTISQSNDALVIYGFKNIRDLKKQIAIMEEVVYQNTRVGPNQSTEGHFTYKKKI